MKPDDIMLVRFPRTDLKRGEIPTSFDDIKVSRTFRDLESSGLKVPSLSRIGKLATVEESILEGQLGKISSKRLNKILRRLVNYFKEQFIEED